MEKDHRYFRLGLFVILTVALLLTMLFILGGRSLFQPTLTIETYFNESVAGLDIGSPVKYRGMPLGAVSEITSSSVPYERDVPVEKRRAYIVVRMKIETSEVQIEQLEKEIRDYIKRGLRAQTQIVGITGQLYVSLDEQPPPIPPVLPFDWTPEYSYIPSVPSLTSEIIGNAQKFLASLNAANIDTIAKNLNTLVETMNQKANQLDVANISKEGLRLLTDMRAAVARIDKVIADAPIDQTVDQLASASKRLDDLLADPGLKQTVDHASALTGRLRALVGTAALDRIVRNLDETIQRVNALVGDNQYDVRVIVQDLRTTSENLRTLSETAKQYPAGIFIGGPPERNALPWRRQQ